MNERLDTLQGQMRAVTEVVTALILASTPETAARAAVQLAIGREVALEEDGINETPSAEARARDETLTAYLGLLSARARQLD